MENRSKGACLSSKPSQAISPKPLSLWLMSQGAGVLVWGNHSPLLSSRNAVNSKLSTVYSALQYSMAQCNLTQWERTIVRRLPPPLPYHEPPLAPLHWLPTINTNRNRSTLYIWFVPTYWHYHTLYCQITPSYHQYLVSPQVRHQYGMLVFTTSHHGSFPQAVTINIHWCTNPTIWCSSH